MTATYKRRRNERRFFYGLALILLIGCGGFLWYGIGAAPSWILYLFVAWILHGYARKAVKAAKKS